MVAAPCLCAVFEYCPRGELFDFLTFTGRLGTTATRTYSHQLLNGLNAIHKCGYARVDLKPENLLLDYDFTLKVKSAQFCHQRLISDAVLQEVARQLIQTITNLI